MSSEANNLSEENGESEWGWEDPVETEVDSDGMPKEASSSHTEQVLENNSINKSISATKFNALNMANQSLQKGIHSSPSFQELEQAIGATLAMNLDSESREESPRTPNTMNKINSGVNLTNQKIQQQRLKQQRQLNVSNNFYRMNSPTSPQTPITPITTTNARQELQPFINEAESRAIILFHSPNISPCDVKDACQKFGVLYYIRPEFHGKGVTLLSYFDLRSAIHAHTALSKELGENSVSSAHYSVMLHAANNNSEEFRLVVRKLPKDRVEEDIEAIFSRYGQLRSIQRTFGTEDGTESSSMEIKSENKDDAISYSIEYFNIQDARLAASELCATSAQIWSPETTVKFAPLDIRKQQLCRQLLATLSRWRAELAATSTYPGSASAYQMPINMIASHPIYQGAYGQGAIISDSQSIPGMTNLQQLMMPHGGGTSGFVTANPHGMPLHPMQPLSLQLPMHMMAAYGVPSPSTYYTASSTSVTYPTTVSANNPISSFALNGNIQNIGGQSSQMMASDISAGKSNPLTSHAQPEYGYSNQRDPLKSNVVNGNPAMGGRSTTQMFPSNYSMTKKDDYRQLPSNTINSNYQSPEMRQGRTPVMEHNAGNSSDLVGNRRTTATMSQLSSNQSPYNYDSRPQHHNGGHAAAGYGSTSMMTMGNMSNNMSMQQAGHGRKTNRTHGLTPNLNTQNASIDAEFQLDLDRLTDGTDTRTTVMVRNIPNKYNQQMLLEEVNVHHEGTYDFFYLPIDFKNKCNVGYCFINFLEPRYIPDFVREFNGQRWRSFNSEKVCVVSFARIQGKAAMVARFQNSSLLEKDDEYRPLLFHSSGPNKGQPEPFPACTRPRPSHSQMQQQQQQQQLRNNSTANPNLMSTIPGNNISNMGVAITGNLSNMPGMGQISHISPAQMQLHMQMQMQSLQNHQMVYHNSSSLDSSQQSMGHDNRYDGSKLTHTNHGVSSSSSYDYDYNSYSHPSSSQHQSYDAIESSESTLGNSSSSLSPQPGPSRSRSDDINDN